jgi:GAF domain-containing protein
MSPSPGPSRTLRPIAPRAGNPVADAATPYLSDVLARASGRMLPERTVDSVLELITSTAVQVVPAASGAGATVATGTAPASTASTDRLVEEADARQYQLDEGPCLTAWRERVVVRVDDLATDARWPRWAAEARGLGLRSTLSAPLVAGDRALGAMKLYSDRPYAFGADDERTLALFAAQAAVLVDAAAVFRRAGQLSPDLQESLRRREVLSQATGIVMGRDRVPAATAFAHLVALGHRDGRSVHEVAQRLVATTSRGR